MRALGASLRKNARAEFLRAGRTFFPIPNTQPESPSLEADVTIMNPVYRLSTMFFVEGNFLK
jgi:hypothetical protein